MTARDLVMGAAGGASAPSDPNFKNVSLLLSGDGTNGAQNNTFLDSSTNNFTITRNGNTTQGSFSPYGDLWSNYFDGSGDYLNQSVDAGPTGTGDFTIEAWVYANNFALGAECIFANYGNGGTNKYLVYCTAGVMQFYAYPYGGVTASIPIPTNTWTHVAVTRLSGTVYLWQNGVQVGSGAFNVSLSNGGSRGSQIGAYWQPTFIEPTSYWNGYISNVRIVQGTAVYTSAFTPSTTPLTAVSGTSLLTCQSNRFIDNSSNNFTLTVNGNTSVQRFSPFNPTAPYDAATIGGSGYFDGSGDYLSVPTSLGSGDFTLEFWFYPLALVDGTAITGSYTSITTGHWLLYVNGSGQIIAYNGPSGLTMTPTLNAWNHVCWTRSGSTNTFYLNGVSTSTGTGSTNFTGIGALYIGSDNTTDAITKGYIADYRLVKGSAIAPPVGGPTSPLTAVSGTTLLCKMQNAGIPDAAMMNHVPTAGTVQVSTSVKKYGTGSLVFDGTGTYGAYPMTLPYSQNFVFGTADFTIECWARFYAFKKYSTGGVFQLSQYSEGIWNTATNSLYVMAYSGAWYFAAANGERSTYGTSVVIDTWYHVALVRNSGVTKLYINGNQIGSVTDTTNYTCGYLSIGGFYDPNYLLQGYIDDLRITKGYARYTANFTPPAQALPTN